MVAPPKKAARAPAVPAPASVEQQHEKKVDGDSGHLFVAQAGAAVAEEEEAWWTRTLSSSESTPRLNTTDNSSGLLSWMPGAITALPPVLATVLIAFAVAAAVPVAAAVLFCSCIAFLVAAPLFVLCAFVCAPVILPLLIIAGIVALHHRTPPAKRSKA